MSFCFHLSFGSNVNSSIIGFIFMGSVVLFMCIASCVLYSAGPGVRRMHVVLSGLRMRLFVCFLTRVCCKSVLG